MKIRNSLKSLKDRHRDNRVIRRRGRVYVINKTQKRFKAPGLIPEFRCSLATAGLHRKPTGSCVEPRCPRRNAGAQSFMGCRSQGRESRGWHVR